jgi:hypothetical protein
MSNVPSKSGTQAMVSSERQLGWLGQPGGRGGQHFRKCSVTDIKYISSKKITTDLFFKLLVFS